MSSRSKALTVSSSHETRGPVMFALKRSHRAGKIGIGCTRIGEAVAVLEVYHPGSSA